MKVDMRDSWVILGEFEPRAELSPPMRVGGILKLFDFDMREPLVL